MDLVLINRYTSMWNVYGITLVSQFGEVFEITKRMQVNEFEDGHKFNSYYYDVVIPHIGCLDNIDVRKLIEDIKLNGFTIMNPFKIVIKNW